MNIFLKIARLLYSKIKYFGGILLWTPIYLRFYIKSHRQFFDIFTHLTKKERLLLYKLVLSLPNKAIVVEIGSYLGASTVFLASAIKDRDGHIYCVDTWSNEAMSEGKRDTFDEFLKNTGSMKDFITPLKGYSVEVAKTFNKGIDLLFIDGDHSYEATKSDVENWVPKVKDCGIIIFHDIGWAEGVKRVVNEFKSKFQYRRTHCG
ncbi:MAG: class I SAM-dependent methyltransferase [Candidatus Brocadia sp.]|jgi:Predicted O-methyltransferase|uniref:Translation elongation factor P n=1 Tax=Candidatus Brocadia fulgida TaxID=380242 RepID=A0A0M2UXS1_9BACT|nr:MAG: translation elongation factor P [Candidatus Brocadia fulgida]UJS20887.1 MAG: class I SAM-dependent methyltransferase [Candidatus Brocadia sp.]